MAPLALRYRCAHNLRGHRRLSSRTIFLTITHHARRSTAAALLLHYGARDDPAKNHRLEIRLFKPHLRRPAPTANAHAHACVDATGPEPSSASLVLCAFVPLRACLTTACVSTPPKSQARESTLRAATSCCWSPWTRTTARAMIDAACGCRVGGEVCVAACAPSSSASSVDTVISSGPLSPACVIHARVSLAPMCLRATRTAFGRLCAGLPLRLAVGGEQEPSTRETARELARVLIRRVRFYRCVSRRAAGLISCAAGDFFRL